MEVLSGGGDANQRDHGRRQKRAKMFFFEGQNIRLIPSCGVFVTMNPGYAGRAELPITSRQSFAGCR